MSSFLSVYKSCKEIYNDDPSSATGVYKLESGEHFCFMETTAVSCEVGGWTLALKVNGSLVCTFILLSMLCCNLL